MHTSRAAQDYILIIMLFINSPMMVLAALTVDRRTIGDPQAILQSWQAGGYTHLLVYRAGADFERRHRANLTSADWQALDDVLSRLSLPTNFGGVYRLFSLSDSR